MATSCCCRGHRCERAAASSAQELTSGCLHTGAASHQDLWQREQQTRATAARATTAAATTTTSRKLARQRERSRSPGRDGRQRAMAVMQCLGACEATARGAIEHQHGSWRWPRSSVRVSWLLPEWPQLASGASKHHKQMPPRLMTAATACPHHNHHHHNPLTRLADQYLKHRPRVSLARLCLLIAIYLTLALELTSASLMSAIVSGSGGGGGQHHNVQQQQPIKSGGGGGELEGSKLARQILASHYQSQMLSHIQSQVASHEQQQQQQQQQRQATTNAAWPAAQSHDHEYAHARQYQHNQQAPAELSGAWSTSDDAQPPLHQYGQQNLYHNQPEPPVNQPQRAAAAGLPAQPTTPTLNKQLAPPPAFLEPLGLMPTNVLQLEGVPHRNHHQVATTTNNNNNNNNNNRYQHAEHATSPMTGVYLPSPAHLQTAESAPPVAQMAHPNSTANSSSGSDRSSRSMLRESEQAESGDLAAPSGATTSQDGVSSSNSQNSDSKFDNNNHEQQQQQQQSGGLIEKGIEPRGQRRRMFNRILKKAEWNHLFVELSKVFLRYFLDLALKDIIGKQSGSLSSSSGGDSTTTGRKKLDAQSELADMLKEFVKTAISNLRRRRR